MSQGSLVAIFRELDLAGVRYLAVGGVAVVMHGHPRFTADLDLVVDLEQVNAEKAIRALANLGYRPRAPVPAETFAIAATRASWVADKGLTVFSLWSPEHPATEVDLFVEAPFDFKEAWARRLDAVLEDGTTVRVVGLDDLRTLKERADRPKDREDLLQLEAIARAMMNDDE